MCVCACVCGIFVYTHASVTIYFNFLCSWDIALWPELNWNGLLYSIKLVVNTKFVNFLCVVQQGKPRRQEVKKRTSVASLYQNLCWLTYGNISIFERNPDMPVVKPWDALLRVYKQTVATFCISQQSFCKEERVSCVTMRVGTCVLLLLAAVVAVLAAKDHMFGTKEGT